MFCVFVLFLLLPFHSLFHEYFIMNIFLLQFYLFNIFGLHDIIDLQDNKRYSFPVILNMKEYCESSCLDEEDQDYELFSVVIHGYVTVLF